MKRRPLEASGRAAATRRPRLPPLPLITYAERGLPFCVLAYALEQWGPRVLEQRRAASHGEAVELARDIDGVDAVEVLRGDLLCWASVRAAGGGAP